MANKMTKREIINALLSGSITVDDTVAQDYFYHELELLDKKSANRTNKPSAKSIENDGFRTIILSILENSGKALSLSEIKALEPQFADFTPQKMSGIIKTLVYDEIKNPDGVIVRTMDKRVAKFSLK